MKVLRAVILPEVELSVMPFWRQTLRGFSQCAFQANEITALFFIAAATLFNWRMGVFYVISVVIAIVVARLLPRNPDLLGLGLYGFNSGLMSLALGSFFLPSTTQWGWVPVLAAVVAAASVAMATLPVPVLAAVVATWIFSYDGRHMPAPALASGFVLTVWGILLLGWLNPRFNGEVPRSTPKSSP